MRVRVTGKSYYSGILYGYEKEYQVVKDSSRLRLRKGDIVQVSHSSSISKYARGQFGVIIDRYRWVKFKRQIYADYGATIMFLTGEKKGCLKKFYATSMGKLSKQI